MPVYKEIQMDILRHEDTHTTIENGNKLIQSRDFKAALELFRKVHQTALSETDKAYAILGDEECQLHLRLSVDDSSEALESALAFFRTNGDKKAVAWALICLAIRSQSKRNFDEAVNYLTEAARIAGETGEREAEARALLDTATMLTFRRKPGDTEKMQAAFDRGYALAAAGDAYERAVADATRGIVRYASSDFADSIRGYRAAAEGFLAVGMPEQALETSVALGVALYRSSKRDEAEKVFRETVELGVKLSRNVETGVALMYLGQLAENSSRYSEAFSHYDEAERRLGPENMYGITLRLGQARALCSMGRYAEAWARLEPLKGDMSASTKVGLPMLKARALSGMGRYAEAMEDADLAVNEATSRGMKEREADARAVRMVCRQKVGSDSLAEEDAHSILDPLNAFAAAAVRGKALTLLASEARKQGDFVVASKLSNDACELLHEIDAPLDLAHALAERGKTLLEQGNAEVADSVLEEACNQAMKVRRDAPEAYRRDFLDSLREIFSARIEFLITRGKIDKAYKAALRLLARSIAERFHLSGEEEPPSIGDAAEFVFLPLEHDIAIFVRTIHGLSARMARLDELFSWIGNACPALSVTEGIPPIDRGFSMTEQQNMNNIGQIANLSEIISQFKENIRNDGDTFQKQAASLYSFFFAHDEAAIQGCYRWILCPAGILSTFPFEALEDANGNFILGKHDVQYIKTPLLAGGHYRSGGHIRPSVLAVGDPLFPEAKKPISSASGNNTDSSAKKKNESTFQASVVRFIGGENGTNLPPLPGAAKEARSASTFSKDNTLLLGADATKKNFIDSLMRKPWGILHIATHALYSENGEEGAILFHPDGDNILSVDEVAALTIDVDDVVLSACASALGKPSWSEGSVGLVDAFMEAGAKNVYATLWSMRDAPTAEFMEKVYEKLKDGNTDFETSFLDCKRQAASGALDATLGAPSLWASFVWYQC